MKSKDFEIRTPFLGVGDPLGLSQALSHYTPVRRLYLFLTIDNSCGGESPKRSGLF